MFFGDGFFGVLDRCVQLSADMNFFYLSTDDLHWLKRWLIKHLVLLILIANGLLVVQFWPEAENPKYRNAVHADDQVVVADGSADQADGSADQEASISYVDRRNHNFSHAWIADGRQGIQLAPLRGGQLISVPPTGWRRTRNGWENTETWRPTLASLGDIVREQQLREPTWIRNLLSQVRSIPPWGFAIFQIAVIAVVLAVADRKEGNRPAVEKDSI